MWFTTFLSGVLYQQKQALTFATGAEMVAVNCSRNTSKLTSLCKNNKVKIAVERLDVAAAPMFLTQAQVLGKCRPVSEMSDCSNQSQGALQTI